MAKRSLSFSTASADRAVRVSVPVKVAFDLGKMQTVTKDVLGRLGCPECHSGFDIRFDIVRQFRFDERLREVGNG